MSDRRRADERRTDFEPDDGGPWASRWRFLAASLAAGTGALGLAGSAAATAEAGSARRQEDPPDGFASVEFRNQSTDGAEVVVDATVVSDGGWVTFHDASLFEGRPLESVVGISEYLDPGVHYRVPATLFDVPGRTFERSELEGTTPLVAMPHRDTNGDRNYEFVTSEGQRDAQYLHAGLPVVDLGFVTEGEPSGNGAGRFASLDFENQAVRNGTVTVEDVVLSDGGFIAMHDARLLRGDPLGSVVGVSEYLDPGEHDVVEVGLDDPSAITEVAFPPAPPLVPMPHLDTDGDEQYTFVESEGGADGPYVEAGQAVVDLGFVTVEQ